MSLPTFDLVEREIVPDGREIQVVGELDLAVAERLRAALERAASERSQVLLNLENCDFIDSTGISVIVTAHRRIGEEGGRVVVFGTSGQVFRSLSVTGLTENGLVVADREAALAETA